MRSSMKLPLAASGCTTSCVVVFGAVAGPASVARQCTLTPHTSIVSLRTPLQRGDRTPQSRYRMPGSDPLNRSCGDDCTVLHPRLRPVSRHARFVTASPATHRCVQRAHLPVLGLPVG